MNTKNGLTNQASQDAILGGFSIGQLTQVLQCLKSSQGLVHLTSVACEVKNIVLVK